MGSKNNDNCTCVLFLNENIIVGYHSIAWIFVALNLHQRSCFHSTLQTVERGTTVSSSENKLLCSQARNGMSLPDTFPWRPRQHRRRASKTNVKTWRCGWVCYLMFFFFLIRYSYFIHVYLMIVANCTTSLKEQTSQVYS